MKVSVLFNESKLLKFAVSRNRPKSVSRFSTLQRVEIAEIASVGVAFAVNSSFSTLQRVEIAEMVIRCNEARIDAVVSVLFNESKLLKSATCGGNCGWSSRFSTLQRVEIAEI